MKKLLFTVVLLISTNLFSQDFETIKKLQKTSIELAKSMTFALVNSSPQKFQFIKQNETKENYSLIYLPIELTKEQIEDSRIEKYSNGVIFRLLKNDDGTCKLREFYAESKVMYSIVESVFYPKITLDDFVHIPEFRYYKSVDNKQKFYFYTGEKQDRFYQL